MNNDIDSRGRTTTFRSWSAMIQRCNDPTFGSYHKYGALGVKVCKRWHTFEHFLLDMGERPSDMTLDRIKSTKNYSPSNCRWATVKTQNSNRPGFNQYVTFKGQTLTRAAWARKLRIAHNALDYRLANWSISRALTEPAKT